MASYIIHLAVAAKVNRMLQLNQNDFYVGNLSPDMKHMVPKARRETHFEVESNETPYGRNVDLQLFINKYREKIKNSDFLKGYLCHLITDKIWFEKFIYHYIVLQPDGTYEINYLNGTKTIGEFSDFRDIMYSEYKMINNYLVAKYNLEFEFVDKAEYYIIEEIIKGGNEKVFESLNTYVKKLGEFDNSKLKVICIEDIDDFINEVNDRVILEITEM